MLHTLWNSEIFSSKTFAGDFSGNGAACPGCCTLRYAELFSKKILNGDPSSISGGCTECCTLCRIVRYFLAKYLLEILVVMVLAALDTAVHCTLGNTIFR